MTDTTELITLAELKRWLQFDQDMKVEKWLRDHGIRYFHGKGGKPVTTATAINAALMEGGAREELRF